MLVQKWYACVANAQFMLNDIQNESFAEQLREKTRFYREKGWDIDFFLVCEPKWLDEQHPQEAKKVQRPCIALIGTEENWIRCAAPVVLRSTVACRVSLRCVTHLWRPWCAGRVRSAALPSCSPSRSVAARCALRECAVECNAFTLHGSTSVLTTYICLGPVGQSIGRHHALCARCMPLLLGVFVGFDAAAWC